MPNLRFLLAALLLIPVTVAAQAPPAVDVGPYIRRHSFEDMVVSPTGQYLAATVPLEDRTGLVVLRRDTLEVTARFTLGKDTHFLDLTWVSPERLLASIAEAHGSRDQPSLTGELFGVDADGRNQRMLVGYRAEINPQASRLTTANADAVIAFLVDDLPKEDNYVLIGVRPFVPDAYTRLERMDVRNGRRTPVTRVSAKYASFFTDNASRVRVAVGVDGGNASQLFHRANDDAEWVLINDENKTGRIESPIGFSADDRVLYLLSQMPEGPDALIAWDSVTGERSPVLRHAWADPYDVLYAMGNNNIPVGLGWAVGNQPELGFVAPEHPDAMVYRMLEKAFPGHRVAVTSTTDDGRIALLHLSNGTTPGEFFLFDIANRKADHLASAAEWIDPSAMGEVRAIELKARDGLTLRGKLTLPPGSDGRGLPMVVLPHGGPFGVFDDFSYDFESQLLARAGYAVLQVNFRGSGGYGRAFQHAGARQWGRTMQDDLTDATKWAVSEGIADGGRICIYGASYGAYASLMGVAREPELYRCAVGYVGVYDLPQMVRDDSGDSASMATFARQWVGRPEDLDAVSPNRLAGNIRVPVFLAWGGEDEIAKPAHSRAMERALAGAGVPVETLYYRNESHGFYTAEHKREYYAKLLDFLARHIGGARAAGN
ncbi:alpha/beta hydrolase family protein [Arenimonas composti]|uniref:alpha/beta hydrolase family protein n=1 Tax=Arenimonas composti TaxID=370776 RepID=UPI000413BB87|nr:S9 family peptidase [Arenimonas composti]